MKKIITIICCVLSAMLLFTGCSKAEVVREQAQLDLINNNIHSLVKLTAVVLPDEQGNPLEEYSEEDRNTQLNLSEEVWTQKQEVWETENALKIESQKVYEDAIESYLICEEESGVVNSISENYDIKDSEDSGLIVTATLVTQERTVDMVVTYDADMTVQSIVFNPVYSFGENMLRAALNTLMGMGTVFVVLILISVLISFFKYIPKAEAAAAKKAEIRKKKKAEKKALKAKNKNGAGSVDNTIAQIIEKEEEELSDDTELVAVIAAAVAAYEGSSSTDGFVVRSIKKSNSRKWQNA